MNAMSLTPFLDILGTRTDPKMRRATQTNGHVDPGVSIRFGPVKANNDVVMEDAGAEADDAAAPKRKSRASIGQRKSYVEPESSEEDDQPLVRQSPSRQFLRSPQSCDAIAVAVRFSG